MSEQIPTKSTTVDEVMASPLFERGVIDARARRKQTMRREHPNFLTEKKLLVAIEIMETEVRRNEHD